jgi:hypothetical protein
MVQNSSDLDFVALFQRNRGKSGLNSLFIINARSWVGFLIRLFAFLR